MRFADIMFLVAGAISLSSAAVVVMAKNAVHSALALVLNFFMLAVFYVLLEAQFLAVVQIIIYAGAIMVLFLFVIMLLGVDREETLIEQIKYQWVAIPLAVIFVGIAILTVRAAFQTTGFTGLAQANRAGNVQGLGRLLFTRYLFPFEVTSLLLIVAAIGAMVIAKRRPADQMLEEEEEA